MNPSGMWRGCCDSRVGNFKFITVELLSDRSSRERKKDIKLRSTSNRLLSLKFKSVYFIFLICSCLDIYRNEDDQRSLIEILSTKNKPETVENLLKLIGLEVKSILINFI